MDNRCRYTRLNGARCTMPALANHDLCFQHEERRRLARNKPVVPETHITCPLVSFCYMDDHASILANLNAIAEAFSRNLLDHRQVGALTYLMQTCLKTLRQMKELETEVRAEDAVRAVEYAADGLPLAADTPAPLTLPAITACADPAPAVTPAASSPRPQRKSFTPLADNPSRAEVLKRRSSEERFEGDGLQRRGFEGYGLQPVQKDPLLESGALAPEGMRSRASDKLFIFQHLHPINR